ncbi:MAG: cytochrome ubiquinol oxidase subunit I, partial [Planctomycetes bacterium]|nr:cytochrome ubiquinol oxidase subunit I [Planctomycetota bacterium]
VGFVSSVLVIFPSGHHHAIQVAETQPEKFAAMEGVTDGEENAGLTVFGIPSEDPNRLNMAVKIPGMLSLMTFGSSDAFIPGLNDLEAAGKETPSFIITFGSFHTMVGLGTFFILFTFLGLFLLYRKKLFDTDWYLKIFVLAIPMPLLAMQVGWIVAEVGRQPWVVYGLLKTRDSFSPNVTGGEILFSIIVFGLIYIMLGAVYLYLLKREVDHGPETAEIREA